MRVTGGGWRERRSRKRFLIVPQPNNPQPKQEDAMETEEAVIEVDEIATLRAVLREAHPDAVEELIAGETIAELLASLAPAREAYGRLIARLERQEGKPPQAPQVPAGGTSAKVDLDSLTADGLIKRGVAEARRRAGAM